MRYEVTWTLPDLVHTYGREFSNKRNALAHAKRIKKHCYMVYVYDNKTEETLWHS